MLAKKILIFNKLSKLSFFYRIKKNYIFGLDLIGTHNNCLLVNIDKILYFIFRLTPFFFNLIKKQGGIFFVGINFILLKWFKNQDKKNQQEVVVIWKNGVFTNFFDTIKWAKSRERDYLTSLPICFIFLNFDKYLTAFKEVKKFNLPLIGLFEKQLNPSLIYSLGGWSQSFFINCFFF